MPERRPARSDERSDERSRQRPHGQGTGAALSAPFTALLHGAGRGVIARVASVGVLFVFNLYIARTLGDAGAGIFFLGLSVVTALAVFARFGLEGPVLRSAAGLVKDTNWAELRADYFAVTGFCIATGAALCIALYMVAPWLADVVFGKAELQEPLRYLSFTLVPLAALIIHARYLRAIEHTGMSLTVQTALIPGLFLALALLPFGDGSAAAAGLGYSVAAGLGLLWAVWYWLRQVPLLRHGPATGSFRDQLRSGRHLLAPSVMDQVIQPLSAVLLLGYWGTAEEVGWFSVANRLAVLVSFAVIPVVAIFSPRVAVLARDNDVAGMRDYSHAATRVILLIAVPMLLLIVLASEWLMGLFGAEFRAGAGLLIVLAGGQAVNALTGPARSLLLMSGKDRPYRRASIAGGLLGLLTSVVLIPLWGATGAAWGASVGIASVNLISAFSVYTNFGILPLRIGRPGRVVSAAGKDDPQ